MNSFRLFSGISAALILTLSASTGCVAAPTAPEMVAVTADVKTLIVAADGSGDYKTVQEAVAAAPENSASRVIIRIKPGKYEEQIIVGRNKPNITLQGEGVEKTILSWNRSVYDPIPEGADKFNPGLFVAANDFHASDLTIENTSGDRGQALAARVDGDRARFENCHLLGWQDTLMVNNGRQYFKNCTIEGRVDFIYGSGTAVFDGCTIHSKNGGYVTAASTPQEQPFGFVFLNCTLTGDYKPWIDPATGQPKNKPGAQAFLGRPWRPYASVAFINCKMGDHVRPEGWNNWGKVENEATARYAEFGSQTLDGTPLDVSKRVPWAKQLSAQEAAQYTIPNILGGKNSDEPFSKRSLVVVRPKTPIEVAPGLFPAANATIYGTSARLENNSNIGFWTSTDTSFGWVANLTPGLYNVAIEYALNSPGTELEIAVGDTKFQLTPAATGSFGTYRTLEIGEVEIKSPDTPVSLGALAAKGTFLLNLRQITLTKAD